MEPGIVQYYEQSKGNPSGIPIVHVGINLQPDQDAQTDNFIRQAGFKIVANDFGRVLASRFQSSGQPIFVIINGVANSPSHKQWELLVNQNGYGTTQHPIESYRAAIDQVRPPPSPPPLETPSGPSITSQPQNQTATVGNSVTLTVAAGGTPPLNFRWRKNSQPIQGAMNATLTLANVQPADAGNYTVEVSNAGGSVTSAAASLTVLAPPTLIVQPQDKVVVAGTNVTFNVSASGTSPLSYQWRFNGADIPGATNVTLTLENVQAAHTGEYRVVVGNALGSATSVSATLTVIVPAAITAQPQNQTAIAGTDVAFSMSAIGTPPLAYQWTFNGVDLFGANSSRLLLTNVRPDQAGGYTVTVRNVAGSVTSLTATLAVIVPVTISAHPQTQKVAVGATVTFTASATGTMPMRFEWRKDGQPIPGASNAILVLENVTSTQSGEYSVQVSNAANSVSSQSATLSILSPPAIRPTLSAFRRFDDGTVEFTLNGERGRTYRIEVSSNLGDWASLTQITATDVTHTIRDPAAVAFPNRFYRAVAP